MRDGVPTFGSLFAGVGGFDYGLERAGLRCAWQVEIDDACRLVLARRWPDVPRHGDIRAVALASTTGEQQLERVDVLVGGFPCQGASVAGKRLGLADDRTALFWEICRVQDALHAPWAILENVPGLRSVTLGRDFETVLAALKERWPVVGWRTLDSRYFGVAQRRARVFFICGPDEARVAQILFEPEGSGRHPTAGGEAGARIAASLTSGAHGAGSSAPGRRKEDDVSHALSVPTSNARYDPNGEPFIVSALGAAQGGSDDNGAQGNRLVVAMNLRGRSEGARPELSDKASLRAAEGGSSRSYVVTHALSAEGCDASEDGTGRGTPLVVNTLAGNSGRRQIEETMIPFDTTQVTSAGNYSAPKPGDPCHPLAAGAHPPAIAFRSDAGREGTAKTPSADAEGRVRLRDPGFNVWEEEAPTLDATAPHGVGIGMAVRRLTPVECERLQGFPDGWTCLCTPLGEWARDPEGTQERCTCPDTPRYKQMGNAVTTTVAEWIGRRLMDAARPPDGAEA